MPLWMFMALMVPFTLGAVNVIDKLVVERYAPSIYFYAFWIGLIEIPVGGTMLLALSLANGVDVGAIIGGMVLGVIRSGSLLMLLTALRHGQLARVAPVYYLYPIMVAPMSAIFLNEVLDAIVWGAIVLSVLGAGLVTWQGRGAGEASGQPGTQGHALLAELRLAFSQPKAQGYALIAGFLFAASTVVVGWVGEREPFWPVFASSRVGLGLGAGLAAVCTADVRHRALGMYRNRQYMVFLLLSELLITGAIMLNIRALYLGPASQVAAIGALQPGVILAYSVALAFILPRAFSGWVTRGGMVTQVAGIGAISAAVVMISLVQ